MHWTANGEEVALFGVNYTAPFAYAYRAHGYVGADRKASIDADVSHLARLGLDAYRIHVWDREISDAEGNLVANDHLDLLDYLIAQLEAHGIWVVLTPIVWNGPGYPERDPPTKGFSNGFSKGRMTVDPGARVLEERYMGQFVRHVNPYTGKSYASDPGILAIELFNEPSHPGSQEEVTRFIDDLGDAARAAGFRKPIFYNISIGWSDAHAKAVCSARIQGITFQWYPSGLVRGSTVRANMLPNVDRYPLPFGDTPECADKMRAVYEFDAADVMGSYMYPAMARSFRGAGMQWATQFAYDPMALAPFNTEYQTHYLNLVYTPRKAISILIAGEAFRRIPRGFSPPPYPASERFGAFRVSYDEDLSEMNTADRFYYSGNTKTEPIDAAALQHVAGWGDSPVVQYEGRGAYFLDRLEDGVWRLELYPDAVQVVDPFGRSSLDREVTRLVWRTWPMAINLPDIGRDFSVRGIDAANHLVANASGGSVVLHPGVYVLRRKGVVGDRWNDPSVSIGTRSLGEIHLPARRDTKAAVVHRPPLELSAGQPVVLDAKIVTSDAADGAELWWRRAGETAFARAGMRRVRGLDYRAEIPGLKGNGALEYAIVVKAGGESRVFPGGAVGASPGDSLWRVGVAQAGAPITLLDPARDETRLLVPHPYRYVRFKRTMVDGSVAGRRALRVEVESFEPDPHHFAIRSFLGGENQPRLAAANGYDAVTLRARSSSAAPERIEVALVGRDGTAWGAVVSLDGEWRDVSVPLSELRPTTLALLPRPYPEFLPNELPLASSGRRSLTLADLDGVQLRIGARLYPGGSAEGAHGFEVESVSLTRGGAR
jgi:hypothetical protein